MQNNSHKTQPSESGAVHKVRQHFFEGGRGQKLQEEKAMTERYKKVLTWGRGVSKIAKKVLTYFMDGPSLDLERSRRLGKNG